MGKVGWECVQVIQAPWFKISVSQGTSLLWRENGLSTPDNDGGGATTYRYVMANKREGLFIFDDILDGSRLVFPRPVGV